MNKDAFRLMEDEGSGCAGGKVRGGLTIGNTNLGPAGALLEFTTGNFNFNFECICASDVVIPIPSSLIKGAAKKFLGQQSLDWILGFMKGQGSKFKDLIKPRTLRNLQTNLDKSEAAWKAYRQKLADTIRPQFQNIIDQRNQILLDLKPLGKDKVARKIEELILAGRRGWIDKRVAVQTPVGRPSVTEIVRVDLTPAMIADYKKQSRALAEQLPEPYGLDILKNLKSSIPLHEAELKGRELFEQFGDIRQAKEKATKAFSDPLANIEETLGNLPPDVSRFVLDSILTGLFTLLDILSIVQEKNCLSNQTGLPDGLTGASLNQENCQCELCPSSKQLCDLRSWIADFLPSIPGTRQSDELNVCMECCDDAKTRARWFRGNFVGDVIKEFGSPPCSCECPSETQRSDEDTEMVPMEWTECDSEDACERGVFTSDKYACRSKRPPDKGASDPLGSLSAYVWDSNECKWLCKEPCESICCPAGEKCYDGVCKSCPPGYRKTRRRFLATQETGSDSGTETDDSEFICEPYCNTPEFDCGTDCCEEDPFLSTFEEDGKVFNCFPCEKTHSLRIDYDSDEPNPWR